MNICWKSSNYSIEKNTLQAPGSLQLYGGQVAGSETVIHAKYDIFNDGNTKGILLIYAGNAFNLINRKVMLYNLKFICLVIATYISNCYICPAALFVISEGELLSQEGTKQGDPTSVDAYAVGVLPLLQFLLDFISVNKLNAKEIAFADDFTVADKILSIKDY